MKMIKKDLILTIVVLLVSSMSFAQKLPVSFGINAGLNLPVSDASVYKTGIHLGLVASFPISESKDAIIGTADINTFPNKRISNDVVKLIGVKAGYRFFPVKNAAFYFQPAIGVGFSADGSSGKASFATTIDIGYLPQLGNGNLNVFGRFNRYNNGGGISFVNLGVGYQFNLSSKK